MNEKPTSTVKVLTGILSAFLSVILVITLVLAPIMESSRGFFKPDEIKSYINNIDYDKALEQIKNNSQATQDDIEFATFIFGLLNTEDGKALIEKYVCQILVEINGEAPIETVGGEDIYNLLKDNIDEIFDFIFDSAAISALINSGIYNSEAIELMIDSALKDLAYGLVDYLPTAADLMSLGGDIALAGLRLFLSPIIPLIGLAIIVILSIAIFFLKCYRRNGLIWLACAYGIGGFNLASLGITLLIGAGGSMFLLGITDVTIPFIIPVVKYISVKLLIFAAVELLLMALAIIWKSVFNSKNPKEAVLLNDGEKTTGEATANGQTEVKEEPIIRSYVYQAQEKPLDGEAEDDE